MYKKIMVPLDGSKLSEAALPPAGAIASPLASEVVLFSVVEPISKGLLVAKDRIEDAEMLEGYALVPADWESRHLQPRQPEHSPEQQKQWENYLATIEDRLRNTWREYHMQAAGSLVKDGVKVSSFLSFGIPAEEIVKYAKKNGVDLIVMSSHGRGGGRWFAGSVAERVVRESPVSVHIVKAEAE